jgi:hypothetical protein
VTRGVAERGAPHPRGRAGLGKQGARGAGRVRGAWLGKGGRGAGPGQLRGGVSSMRRALGFPVARRRRMRRAKGKWLPKTAGRYEPEGEGREGGAVDSGTWPHQTSRA